MEINSIEFLENLFRSHIRLSKNGNNDLEIEADILIPE